MNSYRTLMLINLLLCLGACSTMQSLNENMPWYAANEVESIGLQVSYDAQLQHAISVDVVFVYDENLSALLTSASATQWFQEKPGYLASYGHQMHILHREIVPGYNELINTLPQDHKDAKAVFAFANYTNNPNTKATLSVYTTPWLLFDAQNMALLTQRPQAQSDASDGGSANGRNR
ncbi:hypothetical protein [Alteromonas sp. a30]|uniref:hypothetical protein n=1 Tax=Alteromonas sp. a30 TaxID=2730917 RepID=UPI002280B53F|nr:hypothetical protein [Alteromonas sp. a30]MCY7293847.1 hypothetical protein [Alteromonas sp. a30]